MLVNEHSASAAEIVAAFASVRSGCPRSTFLDRQRQAPARSIWSRYLDTLFELAGIKSGYSRRFRHMFAVELLLGRGPPGTVSRFLGRSPVKATERHYKPWVRSLQRKLEDDVTRAWALE